MILDKILEEKVQFGRAQIITLVFLCLVDLNDGAQLVLSSFLTPVIKNAWDLNDNQVSILTSLFYLGTFLGSFLSGKFSDKYGRRPLILLGSFLQILSSTLFFWVNSYEGMCFARFLYGYSFGFSISVTTTMFAEISPLAERGKGILVINFCVSFGKLYGLILAYIFLQDFYHGNWRAMMILSCAPNIFVFLGTVFYIQQSPRYLVANNRIQQASLVLDNLILENNKNRQEIAQLTREEKQQLQKSYSQQFEGKQSARFLSLFNQQYFKVTICLLVGWVSINFMYFGQLVALPFIFGKQDKDFTSYFITVLGQIPNFLLSAFLIDNPNFGRKKSLCFFYGISSFFHLCFAISPLTLFSSLSRFFMKGCFQMLYPCTTQSYGTLNRTLGFGFNGACGRLGAALMPFIIIPMISINLTLIPLSFMIVSLIGCYASYSLPYDGLNRGLDEKQETELKPLQQESHHANTYQRLGK